MKRWMIVTLGLLMLLGAGLTVLLSCDNRAGFDGNRVANPDSYTLDIRRMSGTDTHTMTLEAGEVLAVRFETEEGALTMEIKAPDGTVLYAGNGREATDFTVRIPADGAYSVTVEARRARGRIHIQSEGKSQ